MRKLMSVRHSQRFRTIVTVLATALVIAPAAALASHQFTDVPNSNTFHADIAWMADNGVTKGCNPPDNTAYCPSDNVTREQMAAFMHRLETEGVFLPADGQAADADTVDGLDATELRAGVPVAQGLVDSGSVTLSRDYGLTGVTRTGTGIYCVKLDPSLGLTNLDIIATVSVEWGGSFGNSLAAFWHMSSGCASDEVSVRTYNFSGTLTNNVSFVVTVTEVP